MRWGWRVLAGLACLSFAYQLQVLMSGGTPNALHVGLALAWTAVSAFLDAVKAGR